MAYFKSIQFDSGIDPYVEAVISANTNGTYTGIKALKNSDVLTAVSIIAGDIASFPLSIKDKIGETVIDDDLDYIMNVKATENSSYYHWAFAMVVNSILCGNSYSKIIKDKNGKILTLEFLQPSKVIVEKDENTNRLYYTVLRDNKKNELCEDEDIIHIKFFTHDSMLGRSPLLSLSEEISLQENGVDTLIKFFKSGFSSGILRMKGAQLGREARKKAREEFEYTRDGATGGSPIVLDDTIDYTPLEIDTNVLQLINSNNYSTEQIAKALRIPAYKLAVNSPNQSVQQLNTDYVTNGLIYYSAPWTSELTIKILSYPRNRTQKFVLDTSRITNSDRTQLIENTVKLVNNKMASPNEGRNIVGMKKIDDPNMDKVQSSLNYVFMDKQEMYQELNKSEVLTNAAKGGESNESNGD